VLAGTVDAEGLQATIAVVETDSDYYAVVTGYYESGEEFTRQTATISHTP